MDGTIDLETPGKTYKLACTPRAMMTLFGAQFGGAAGLIDRLKVLDVEAIAAVIIAGANVPPRAHQVVWQHVFDAGPANIVARIVDYVVMLNNGGRMPETDAGADEGNAAA